MKFLVFNFDFYFNLKSVFIDALFLLTNKILTRAGTY